MHEHNSAHKHKTPIKKLPNRLLSGSLGYVRCISFFFSFLFFSVSRVYFFFSFLFLLLGGTQDGAHGLTYSAIL